MLYYVRSHKPLGWVLRIQGTYPYIFISSVAPTLLAGDVGVFTRPLLLIATNQFVSADAGRGTTDPWYSTWRQAGILLHRYPFHDKTHQGYVLRGGHESSLALILYVVYSASCSS